MNQALGKVVTAVMIDENDQDYFVQPDRNGQTYRLPKDEAPQVLHIGGSVSGFVYENDQHQLQMTCQQDVYKRQCADHGDRRDQGLG